MLEGHDIVEIEKRLEAAAKELQSRTAAAAEARQVKRYSKRTEECLVSDYMVKYLKAGETAAAAKAMAMADPQFKEEFKAMRELFQRAEKHLLDYDVAVTKWESARSLLSMAKAQLQPAYNAQRNQT